MSISTGRSGVRIRVGTSTLFVVPAVHGRVKFAEAVNELCRSPDTRPDAIAVELAPPVAAQACTWMRELGIGPGRRTRLPVMLGLTGRQRWLRHDMNETALELQRESGLELHEVAPRLLERVLGHRSHWLIMLSTTDSIIEALRCGCELDVPCHGVDLLERGRLRSGTALIPDTADSGVDVGDYFRAHPVLSRRDGDPVVNGPRERVMARSLKWVLFTCGLAHARRVIELVLRGDLAPRPLSTDVGADELAIQRVVVDPSVAWHALDHLPVVAHLFERRRRHPRLDAGETSVPVPVLSVHQAALRRAIRRTLHRAITAHAPTPLSIAEARLAHRFPRTLAHHGLLTLAQAPDLGTIRAAAAAFVGEGFAQGLTRELIRHSWARPGDFPGCSTVGPGHGSLSGGCELPAPVPADGATTARPRACARGVGYGFTWSAWEDLCTALADSARRSGRTPARVAEPDDGSAHEGLALRATLRAHLRGDSTVHVWHRPQVAPGNDSHSPFEGWPVVFIFEPGAPDDCTWREYCVPIAWLLPHARSPDGPVHHCARDGRNLSALIGYGRSERIRGFKSRRSPGIGSTLLSGLLLWGPVFSANTSYARWVERTHGRMNPVYRETGANGLPTALCRRVNERLGQPLGERPWYEDIIRMALPYANRSVTVVAPRNHRFSLDTRREARRLGIELTVSPLERFDPVEIARVRRIQTVPGVPAGVDGATVYEGASERVLGEERTRYRARVPMLWREFGR